MCVPDTPKIANIVSKPTAPPEKAPNPIAIAPVDDTERLRKGRKDLRIDLASSAPSSGVVV